MVHTLLVLYTIALDSRYLFYCSDLLVERVTAGLWISFHLRSRLSGYFTKSILFSDYINMTLGYVMMLILPKVKSLQRS